MYIWRQMNGLYCRWLKERKRVRAARSTSAAIVRGGGGEGDREPIGKVVSDHVTQSLTNISSTERARTHRATDWWCKVAVEIAIAPPPSNPFTTPTLDGTFTKPFVAASTRARESRLDRRARHAATWSAPSIATSIRRLNEKWRNEKKW